MHYTVCNIRFLTYYITLLIHLRVLAHTTPAYSRILAHTRAYPNISTHTRAYLRILGHIRAHLHHAYSCIPGAPQTPASSRIFPPQCTLAYTRRYPRICSRINPHTHAQPRILAHTHAYSRIPVLAHTRAYSRMLVHTRAYSCILAHTRAYPRIPA